MEILENIKTSLSGLLANKMRSFLTMLGIIIGIASVIGILTIGRSLSNTISSAFSQMDAAAIQVMVGPKEGYNYDDISSSDLMTKEDIDLMEETFKEDIKSIVLSEGPYSGTVTKDRETANVSILGTSPGTKDMDKLEILAGRFLNDEDIERRREVGIISDKVVDKIYGGSTEKALGSEIEVSVNNSLRSYRVVGIYKYVPFNAGIFGGENEDSPTSLYIATTVANSQFNSSGDEENYQYILVLGKDSKNVDELSEKIKKYFNEGKYLEKSSEIDTYSLQENMNETNSAMANVQLAIGAIAAISLLVGGIGVMNILLVSVTERTREIGIRKALGATNKDIRLQFIIESIIICVIGGILGIILGAIIGYAGSSMMKEPTLPSIGSVILAVGFSMTIGIFFGYYPANKAAKLNPIDALRYE
ncbi:ABC transporter permease [Peptoniphilus catoniae]|uniref:ABC transporter permease n=1 Tax=Peptoniphilus catoniae TaxID=1660341 RepID=UPI0010FF0394|nr:ABC transporter permease [Peptoniphilus catoniae]